MNDVGGEAQSENFGQQSKYFDFDDNELDNVSNHLQSIKSRLDVASFQIEVNDQDANIPDTIFMDEEKIY